MDQSNVFSPASGTFNIKHPLFFPGRKRTVDCCQRKPLPHMSSCRGYTPEEVNFPYIYINIPRPAAACVLPLITGHEYKYGLHSEKSIVHSSASDAQAACSASRISGTVLHPCQGQPVLQHAKGVPTLKMYSKITSSLIFLF